VTQFLFIYFLSLLVLEGIMFSALARKSVSSSASSAAVVRNATVVRSTAVRSFASSEAADDKLKHAPPVSVYGTVARYANATYSAASKQGLLDQVESELNGLAKAAKDSQAFSQFLENPLISRNDKSSLIESILQEKNISVITTNLCTTLAGNARLNELTKVVSTYSTLMKAKRGEVDATIISADPLTKKETEQVAAAIKATSKATGEVIISSKVDPSIIGGIQVQIGDQFLDLSIKSRIEEISRMSI
jgi:F-type H+-transporting ATPase subunit O